MNTIFTEVDPKYKEAYKTDQKYTDHVGFLTDGSGIITKGKLFGTVNIVLCDSETDIPKDNPEPNTLYLVKDNDSI